MTFDEFLGSIENEVPPDSLSATLRALWYEKKGDWDRAHAIVQEVPSTDGYWVHAYLHRVEGDLWNARYWYSRAGLSESKLELHAEWNEIVSTLISR